MPKTTIKWKLNIIKIHGLEYLNDSLNILNKKIEIHKNWIITKSKFNLTAIQHNTYQISSLLKFLSMSWSNERYFKL